MIDIAFLLGKLMVAWAIGYCGGMMVLSVKKMFETGGQ